MGCKRTWLRAWVKACVRAWTTLMSSLFAGPTAIRRVTGRVSKYYRAASAPSTASTAASVTNIASRRAERGDAAGSTRSRSPLTDLANNRLRLNFIWTIWLDRHCSKIPAGTELHRRHGYLGPESQESPPGRSRGGVDPKRLVRC